MLTGRDFMCSKVKTGRSIGQSAWITALIEEMGSSYFMVHVSAMWCHALPFDTKFHDGQHADLLDVLFRLASSAGARVNFGVTVESVEPARETPPETSTIGTPIAEPASHTLRPAVRLKTGEILHADVIIGADGPRSIVRPVVSDEDEEEQAIPVGLSLYTGTIPMAKVRKYAQLKQLVDVGWPVWLGDRRVVLGTSSTLNLGKSLSF